MSHTQILAKLSDQNDCYEVEFEGKKYQVEVDLLENTERYLHVEVSVDDVLFLPLFALSVPVSFAIRTQRFQLRSISVAPLPHRDRCPSSYASTRQPRATVPTYIYPRLQ